MLKTLAKRLARKAGLEIRRAPDPSLPYLNQIEIDDLHFKFWITNQHTKAWWGKPRITADAELRELRRMSEESSIVFDVGAHHGFTSVLLSLWIGDSGFVHAFEPVPDNCLVLNANLAVNGITNCTTVQAAVGAERGTASLDGESIGTRRGSAGEVGILTLDEYCSQMSVGRVDAIKIDVEGYELKVLEGARELLSTLPRIDLEVHHDLMSRYGGAVRDLARYVPFDAYDIRMMVRPDWETLSSISSVSDLPTSGVSNLFFWPKKAP